MDVVTANDIDDGSDPRLTNNYKDNNNNNFDINNFNISNTSSQNGNVGRFDHSISHMSTDTATHSSQFVDVDSPQMGSITISDLDSPEG